LKKKKNPPNKGGFGKVDSMKKEKIVSGLVVLLMSLFVNGCILYSIATGYGF
jgi:hypothetical protein